MQLWLFFKSSIKKIKKSWVALDLIRPLITNNCAGRLPDMPWEIIQPHLIGLKIVSFFSSFKYNSFVLN